MRCFREEKKRTVACQREDYIKVHSGDVVLEGIIQIIIEISYNYEPPCQ